MARASGRAPVLLAALLLAAVAVGVRVQIVGRAAGGLPQWQVRAERFFEALEAGRLAETYQAPHPGLTVLWLSGASQRLSGASSLHAKLVAATLPVATLGGLLVLLVAALLRRVLALEGEERPGRAALAAGLLLALDPLSIVLGGNLTLDGLLAPGFLAAYLLAEIHLRAGSRGSLVAAALASGLVVATKAAGLLLAPVVLLAVVVTGSGSTRGPGALRRRRTWTVVAAILAGSVLVPVLLLPAFWVEPISTARTLLSGDDPAGSLERAITGRHPDVFFLGEATRRPGPLFYPLNLLYRATPLALLGLVLLPLARRRRALSIQGGLVAVLLILLLALTLVSKKGWRYVSLALPPLDVLGGLGLAAAGAALARRRRALAAVVPALLVLHGAWVVSSAPYQGLLLNPLLGGARTAARVVPLGWGEGIEQAMAFLDAEAGRRGSPVTWSGGYRGPFGSSGEEFATDRVRWIGRNPEGIRADYHVLVLAYTQRGEERERETDRWWEENGRVVLRVVVRDLEVATVLGRAPGS